MSVIEPRISPFIPQQFPALYQKDDPKFILFVQHFYEYLEQQGNPLYYTRNFPILDDVDTTTETILTFIKQKYFLNIQLSTQANIRQIVKHCLDIYRSKGTQRCIELLFRLVFDEVVDFYYPKDDIMKLSSGNWYVPKYIELSLNHVNSSLFHKKIQGLISGATAFVDSIVRSVVHNRYVSLAYISAIEGEFVTGEIIFPTDNSVDISNCPTMIGSLTDVTISAEGSGLGFKIGDLVNINSFYGEGAVGLVTGIVDTIGELSYAFNDGGYGYSNTTFAHLANAHLQLQLTNFANTYARRFLAPYESISQPLGEINFSNAVWTGNTLLPANGVPVSNITTPFTVGSYVATSNDGTTLALVVNSSVTLNVVSNTYFGTIFISPMAGVCNADPVYAVNVATNGAIFPVGHANHTPLSNGFTDVTAVGKYIGTANVYLGIVSNTSAFIIGETIIQHNILYPDDPIILGQGTFQGFTSNNELILDDVEGVFRNGRILGTFSNTVANAAYVIITVGIVYANNNFIKFSPSPNVSSPSLNAIMVNLFQTGDGASLTFSNNLQFPSTYHYNTDLLSGFLNTRLNAATYGFTANGSANIAWGIANSLSYTDIEIGSLISYTVAPGSGYEFAPLVYIDDYRTAYHNVFDINLQVSNASQFFVGIQVSQASTNALGKIVNVDIIRNSIDIRNYRFNANTQFVPTTDNTSLLIEQVTGVTTNVLSVSSNRDTPAEGRNANVITTVATGNGSLLDLEVLYSGFGYIEGEQVWMDADNIQGSNTAFGVTDLGKIGKGQGFYRDKNGFLSDSKKLYDGYYYQTFSYEIQSSTVFGKYEKLIKQIGHPSGTKMFGRIVHKTKVNSSPIIESAIISQGPVLWVDPTHYHLHFYPRGFVEQVANIHANSQNVSLLYGRVLTAGGSAVTANVNLTGMPIVGAKFPTIFADFVTNNYYFTSNQYGSFSSWMTAIGATLTRASNATYTQAGVIQTALADTIRFPTDLNSKPLGIRLTGPGTNIILHSPIDATNWTTAGNAFGLNATVGPDGLANTAHTLTPNTTSTNHGIFLTAGTTYTANTYTHSFFAKNNGYNFAYIDAVNGGLAAAQWAVFDLTTGVTVRGANTVNAGTTQLANGWWQCWLTSVMPAALRNNIFGGLPSNSYVAFAGNGTSGIKIFGAQATLSTFVLDYIPSGTTNGVQVFDKFQFPYAQTTFTALLKTTLQGIPVTGSQRLLGQNTGSAPIYMISNTTFATFTSSIGSLTGPVIAGSMASNNKVMVAGNGSFRAITADGAVPITNNTGIVNNSTVPATMWIGSDGTSSSTTGAYGNFLHFALWNNQIANTTEMQTNTL